MRSRSLSSMLGEFLLDTFASRRVHVGEIRRTVKDTFPELCDDHVLCKHETPHRPEWWHRTRHALDYLSNRARRISHPEREWYQFP